MKIRFSKVCMASLLMIYAVIFTGCSNNTQKVLVLDKNEPIEALRVSLSANKQSELLTPLSNPINLKTFNVQLGTSASLRFELPAKLPCLTKTHHKIARPQNHGQSTSPI